jgi:exodeoxyribonuclease VII large subunit
VQAGPFIEQLTGHCRLLGKQLQRAMMDTLNRCEQRLALAQRALDAVSPLAVLGRGYALVATADGQLLRQAQAVREGDELNIRLATGRLRATVRSTEQT